ncbi:STAS domain-containing protein [Streptomyces kunmingensis]|uniref:Anti-sigma factor antagonist n=1 Tax=Streptomyces kunmingensis TaxID=68225 RepID=A0ABU6CA27_9ACTN|nr:STAS domain-containing protein [Streptomyces kunmingensis]MEB3961567.1 STAS domain-containing protein [Streptomyces kunmingensis]
MSPLKITAEDGATGPVLRIAGDLDHDTAPELRGLLPTIVLRPGQSLVLDLAAMPFCDSSGVSALIAAHNHALAAGAGIALVAVPANTLRILRIVGLDQVFAIHPDLATATRAG